MKPQQENLTLLSLTSLLILEVPSGKQVVARALLD